MSPTICLNCGSRAFRADRALAGRLVCQRCGLAAGSRPAKRGRGSSHPFKGSASRWRWILVLVVVAIVVIAFLG
ncbi:MAG: transcriptional regulator [Synechococcus sp. MED850]|nr:transcriptional regulator [Synechococcus sp. MED850]OUW98176.1 MAG: transcriptional regulator [Cyanobacteria bacterium TMED229]